MKIIKEEKRKRVYSVSGVASTVDVVVILGVSSAPFADRLAIMPNFVSGVYAPPA
jgi:hypothetical protein